jgi:imidazolonepropionase
VDGLVTYAGPARQESPPFQSGGNPYPARPIQTIAGDGTVEIDAKGALVTPGLIDPHTHAVFGGERALELPLKVAGVPYLEILAQGGGILSTVRATRAATDDELYASAETRIREMSAQGVTAVEVKSGYGLSLHDEMRILGVIDQLRNRLDITVVSTFMGAHAVPAEFKGRTDDYVSEVIERMLPAVAERSDVAFCDVFCEAGVFSMDQSRRILLAARSVGLGVKLHVDEISSGDGAHSGAELAAELRATSADHLRVTPAAGMSAMHEAGVVPVVLPATSFCLRDGVYADARSMIDDYGLPVALATDCNPGTSPTESIQMVMSIAALYLKLKPAEILRAVTIHAARAIGIGETHGSLAPGKRADLVIWRAYDLAVLPYRFGTNQAALVIRGGEPVNLGMEADLTMGSVTATADRH